MTNIPSSGDRPKTKSTLIRLAQKRCSLQTHGKDWENLLEKWNWRLPEQWKVRGANAFGDLFLEMEDKSIHMLDVGEGTLQEVAPNLKDFHKLSFESPNEELWFKTNIVRALLKAGNTLQDNECISYRKAPFEGGEMSTSNLFITYLKHHYDFLGKALADIARKEEGSIQLQSLTEETE